MIATLKTIFLLLTVAGSVLLTACEQNTNPVTAPSTQKADAVAVVNGQYISQFVLNSLTTEVSRQAGGQDIEQEKLIDELVRRELLIQQAKSKNLQVTPETQHHLIMMYNDLLWQLALEDYKQTNPVTNAEIKAEYDQQIAKMQSTEYKARHILVTEERDAVPIIAELDKGGDFVQLAKSKSTGPSKTKGGDLGWFSANKMVPSFSAAVVALENGAYTKSPVKTQFGWHIILREDSRDQVPPPLEAVKPQLERIIQREKVSAYLDLLEKDAEIEILLPEEVKNPEPEATMVKTPITNTDTETAPDQKE